MKKLSQDSSGVWMVGVLLAVAIVAMIVFIGVDVLKKDKSKTSNNTNSSQSATNPGQKKEAKSGTQEITLSDNKVSFRVPDKWTNEGVGCTSGETAFTGQEYDDSALLYPGEKLPTKYADGTEHFSIRVCVFNNKDNLSAETWYKDSDKGIGAEAITSRDTTSADKVNGYDAFYHKRVTSGLHEVRYIVVAHGKIVFVNARTYEPGTLADKPVGDFRKFEPAIAELVDSLTIEP